MIFVEFQSKDTDFQVPRLTFPTNDFDERKKGKKKSNNEHPIPIHSLNYAFLFSLNANEENLLLNNLT